MPEEPAKNGPRTDEYPPGHGFYQILDHLLARPMFVLSLIFLGALAGVLHRHVEGEISRLEAIVLFWTVCLLWPVFIAEAVLRFIARSTQLAFGPRLAFLLGNILLPPLRLGARSYADPRLLWLPGLGWQPVNKTLRRRLERAFSVPMIIIALMVLPFLAVEYFYEETIKDNFLMELVVDAGTSIIWGAFAFELVIMVSVARNRIQYVFGHWIDVAVVLLPLLDFMPMLRLLRLAQFISLQKLTSLGRLYRLRGLMLKAWRALLVLDVLQRLLNSNPEKRLQKMRELLQAKEEEIEDLRREMEELEKKLAHATKLKESL